MMWSKIAFFNYMRKVTKTSIAKNTTGNVSNCDL